VHLLAYLLLPRFFGNDKKMDANGYAALKELDYYSTHHFTAQWDPQLGAVTVPPPPFDYCYLLDSRNMAGEVTGGTAETREAVLEMLADTIFKDFTHGGFADQKRRCRVNIGPRLSDPLQVRSQINGLEFSQSFPMRYQSLGQASIVMPHDRIITACAYQLAADVVAYWSGSSGSSFPVALLTDTVRTRILPHPQVALSQEIHRGAQQNQLLDRVGREAAGSGQLVAKVDSWAKETADRVLRGIPAQQRKSYRAFLEQEIEQETKSSIASPMRPPFCARSLSY
jgi:hypothetical protein